MNLTDQPAAADTTLTVLLSTLMRLRVPYTASYD